MSKILIKNLARAIYETTSDKEGDNLNKSILNCSQFIRDKNLLNKKKEILSDLEEIINKENGIVKIEVSSRKKLNEKIEKEIEDFIKKKYKAKEIIIDKKINDELIGGIKIKIGDDIIDTTLLKRINQLQNYLIKN